MPWRLLCRITHVDHQLGRILTALKEDGSYDNTIILFTSDHGEMLFDHSLWRKVFPYEGSIHIPFLLHIGKNIADIVPHTVNGITELRDVMPTLLDLCNLPIPETVDGSSLKRCILQEAEAVRSYLHGEHSFHDKLSNHYIVTEQDKFIWYSETGEEQYFDLRQD
ncbi:MAG: sulfatase-like hydrolase/transferase, partial [[Clostridium] innocuum]